MKKSILTFIGVAAVTSASAADLPRNISPASPSVVLPTTETSSFYIGASIGSVAKTDLNPWYGALRVNVRGGYEFSDYARVEANYDYNYATKSHFAAHILSTNLIGQYKISYVPVVPYVLAGVGYRFSPIKNEIVYNLGAGVRYEITKDIEADLRYKYVTDFKRARDESVITIGANYKF